MYDMMNDISEILIPEKKIDELVSSIASQIDRDYKDSGRELLLLAVLKGSVVFMGDLMKKLRTPAEIDFMKVSSYSGTETRGKVDIILDIHRASLQNTDIIIVEDIVDSGNTLSYLTDYLRLKGAESVRCATLLDKPSRRRVSFRPDYTGMTIPDYFVVGYGLDYNEKYRNLPFVGILKPEVYKN